MQSLQRFHQIRANRIGCLVPDDKRFVIRFGAVDGLQQAVEYIFTERVHFRFERDNGDVVEAFGGPHAHALSIENGRAFIGAFAPLTEQQLAE